MRLSCSNDTAFSLTGTRPLVRGGSYSFGTGEPCGLFAMALYYMEAFPYCGFRNDTAYSSTGTNVTRRGGSYSLGTAACGLFANCLNSGFSDYGSNERISCRMMQLGVVQVLDIVNVVETWVVVIQACLLIYTGDIMKQAHKYGFMYFGMIQLGVLQELFH